MRMTRSPAAALSALLLAVLTSACAVAREEHRNVLEWLDDSAAPESVSGRALLAPVALPVSLLAYVGDSFLVNPVRFVDDAWYDTVEALWEPQADETTFRRVLLVPLAAIGTPIVWVGDWLGRILLPIPGRDDH